MTHSNETLLQSDRQESKIQAHLNVARGMGIERAKEDTAATRHKEAFIQNLMISNAEAHGHHGLVARLRGEAVELEPGEETAFAMLDAVRQIMATEDQRSKLPSYGARYKLYKSPSGQDSSEAASLAAEILELNKEEGIQTSRKIRGDILEEEAFISPWHLHYDYEGRLEKAAESLLWKKRPIENIVKPAVRQALREDHDPEEVTYLLEGPQPLWQYEIAARNGTLEELLAHNGLLKAIEEKAYRESITAAKSVRLVERRTIDKKTHDLKEQRYFLEIG